MVASMSHYLRMTKMTMLHQQHLLPPLQLLPQSQLLHTRKQSPKPRNRLMRHTSQCTSRSRPVRTTHLRARHILLHKLHKQGQKQLGHLIRKRHQAVLQHLLHLPKGMDRPPQPQSQLQIHIQPVQLLKFQCPVARQLQSPAAAAKYQCTQRQHQLQHRFHHQPMNNQTHRLLLPPPHPEDHDLLQQLPPLAKSARLLPKQALLLISRSWSPQAALVR
mmetsp:Transcript_20665/g.45221  ORF Transcript_20665/g.45221 Transcript_20665/m.45221 type:complete len:218 (-) Transcript_20665:1716-2369(-)